MAPASVGPVKSMILSLDVGALERWMEFHLANAEGSLRAQLKRFAEEHRVEI
jgi:phosphotransferase system enzyme I (PtsP)